MAITQDLGVVGRQIVQWITTPAKRAADRKKRLIALKRRVNTFKKGRSKLVKKTKKLKAKLSSLHKAKPSHTARHKKHTTKGKHASRHTLPARLATHRVVAHRSSLQRPPNSATQVFRKYDKVAANKYYIENREVILAKAKKYYKNHREEILAKAKERRRRVQPSRTSTFI